MMVNGGEQGGGGGDGGGGSTEVHDHLHSFESVKRKVVKIAPGRSLASVH